MHNERPIQQSHLQVKTDLTAVTEVLQWFEEFTSSLLPQQLGSECQLALVEGFTNAVRHAHHDLPPTTPIDLELKIFPDFLEMRIWDHGPPFDFQAKLQSLCQEEYDPLEKEGGRGLIFMKQLTDELSYARLDDDRNCLLMRKRR
ncbi:MAG: ATP-binding protein [Microcoleus sp. SIO2G3]|nr:ATP-binding protein [Microcoleus sp. SIO2G3]